MLLGDWTTLSNRLPVLASGAFFPAVDIQYRFLGSQDCRSPIIRLISISRCDPLITMVKTTEFRDFDDRAMVHDLVPRPDIVFQRQMRTRSMVIVEVCGQRSLQMASVQDNEVI